MATNDDRNKATGLQKALETQLLALEKLGVLPTTAADEVRNIVAEGIADKFGETYRTFPCVRQGTEIRRDAVPNQCALRKSVEGFVANARASEKTSKVKGQAGQKKVVGKTTAAKVHATSNAPAKVHVAQLDRSSNIAQAARCQKTSSNPSNPTKDVTPNDWQQTRLESGVKAWDVLLAQKAGAIQTPTRADNQQKPTTQGTGSPMAPVTQREGVGASRGGRATAVAKYQNGNEAAKAATAPRSLASAAGTTGDDSDRSTTTGDSTKPKSSSTGKASIDSSEDLIDFSF